jgi:hypothetical protein
MMKINIKNSSTATSRKVDAMKQFLRFSQESSPLNREIEIIFVDSTNDTLFESKYFIPLRNMRSIDCYKLIADKWISEFSKQRKINCGEKEKELLVEFFLKKNPHLKNVI